METKETNLYKAYAKGWNAPAYVAADNQQAAVPQVEWEAGAGAGQTSLA